MKQVVEEIKGLNMAELINNYLKDGAKVVSITEVYSVYDNISGQTFKDFIVIFEIEEEKE